MFEQFYGLSYNPFSKAVPVRDGFKTDNLTQVRARLDHLMVTGGIGLVCADPGHGKTFALRSWTDGLNHNTTKVVYLCMSTLTTGEFYRQLCYGLDIEPAFKKVDMFRDVQARIRQLNEEKHMKVVVIVDEAQFLSASILRDLVMITNFNMDSRDCFALVLVGQVYLKTILSRQPHEALRQRIVVNYTFTALKQAGAVDYLRNMLKAAGGDPELLDSAATATAFAACGGSLRRLGLIVTNALIVGAQAQSRTITEDMVLAGVEEETLG